jgi:BASS family bile acid:Na+ symporter
MAGGDSALSVSLTAVTSLLGVLSVPLIVNLGMIMFMGGNGYTALPVGSMVVGLFLIATVPLLAGMLLKNYQPGFVSTFEPVARKLAVALFLMIVLATFAGQWGSISEFFVEVGPAVLALNTVTMGFAMLGARRLKLERRQAIAISLECGLQNAAMGIFVASTLLQNSDMVIPSVVYALVMNLSAAVFITLVRVPASVVPVSGQ